MEVTNLTADAEVFTSNAYYVPGKIAALVDVGTVPGVAADIVDLDVVVLTHQHGDHVGELESVIDEFDPDLGAYSDHPHLTRKLDDGDVVTIGNEEFEAVYTPGHAGDHLAFASATTLFSGDVIVYNDAAFDDGSFGRTDRPGQSRERLIRSLEELLDRLEPTVEHLYAGHGGPFHGDVHDVIERALDRARRREPKYPDDA